MHLRIDSNSGVPLGPQIVGQIKLAIASGRLSPGERLPSARDLAAELHVNFHTVRKAFAALEQDGLLESARGRGTFVARDLPSLGESQIRETAREHLQRLCEDIAGADLEDARLREILLEEFDALRNSTRSAQPPSSGEQQQESTS